MKNKGIFIGILVLLITIGGYFVWQQQINSPDDDDKEVVKIGIITPLSGEVSTYGEATRKGIEIALEENKGILLKNNININPLYEDSKLEAKSAVNAMNKLVSNDQVVCILGPFGSSNVLATASLAENKEIPVLSASATADDIRTAGEYTYRNVPSNNLQGVTMAKYVVNSKKYNLKKIAIYYLNNDYGISLLKSFSKYIIDNGGDIIIEDSFESGQKDFRTSLNKIKELQPSFVYIPDHYNEAGLILKQAKEIGLNVVFGGGDGSYSEDLIKIAGESAEGYIITLMGTTDSQSLSNFNKMYYKKYKNESPDVYSVYAYDAMKLYIEIIIELHKHKKEITGKTIKKSLDNIIFDGATGKTKFDNYGEVNKPFNIYEVKNQKFKKIENNE